MDLLAKMACGARLASAQCPMEHCGCRCLRFIRSVGSDWIVLLFIYFITFYIFYILYKSVVDWCHA